jgi:uncharacterized protein YgiM (DUF1202 family)
MSNDPLKNWQLEEGSEPLDKWKLQDAEQATSHLQLQETGEVPSDWQPVEYQRAPTRSGRNWVLPSIVIVALLVALGYVGYVSLSRLGLDDFQLGPLTIGAPAPTATATETASEQPAPVAVATEAVTEESVPAVEPPTATPSPEPTPTTPALITTRVGTVNEAAGVNARREPTTTGEIIRLLNNGESFTVVRQDGDWLQVILADNQPAWVWAEFIDQAVGDQLTLEEWNARLAAAGLPPVAAEATSAPAETQPAQTAVVTLNVTVIADPGATLRIEPATQAQVVGEALLGTILTASGRTEASDWLLATLPDGRRGWISTNLATIAGDATTLSTVDSNILLNEGITAAPGLPTPTPATVTNNAALTLATNGVQPAAPFTNTIPTIGQAIAISDTAGVRARAAPSLTAETIGFIPNGAVLPAIGRSPDNLWVQVTLPDDQQVWVFRDVVVVSSNIDNAPVIGEDGAAIEATATPAEAPAADAGTPAPTDGAAQATISSLLGANIRTEPNNESDTLNTVGIGAAFPATGRTADSTWIQIVSDGATGWLLATAADLNVDIETLPVVP